MLGDFVGYPVPVEESTESVIMLAGRILIHALIRHQSLDIALNAATDYQ
jgi:hypothetical protein